MKITLTFRVILMHIPKLYLKSRDVIVAQYFIFEKIR